MYRRDSGQTLIEVLVALGTAVVVVSAIVVSVIFSLNNVSYGKNQNLATQYAQEGMEVTRRIRNINFTQFQGYAGEYCLGKNVNTLSASVASTCPLASRTNCTQNLDSTFIRRICIDQPTLGGGNPNPDNNCKQQAGSSSQTTQVKVDVFWSDGKCTDTNNLYCHSSELVSCFTNPSNAVPTP